MADKTSPTLGQAVERVLNRLREPISVDEFAKRVLAIYPSKAKNPTTSIRSHLRMEHTGQTLVFLDRQTLIPLRFAMQGVRFRIPLTRQEANRGVLIIDPAFRHFQPREIEPQHMQLLDADGRPLPNRMVTLKQKVSNPLGPFTREIPTFELGDWFHVNRVRRDSSILVTIEDWQKGHFRLQHEAAKGRRQAEIEGQNQALADLLFDLLEDARNEQIYAYQAIPTVYARLPDPRGYPGDHWAEVIASDERMSWDGFAIRYSEFRSPFEALLGSEGRRGRRRSKASTREQARQVYRFKAALWHRTGLWRRLEIQGDQTLADFDVILRGAFQHDTGDHLGGFWRRVRRGKGQRVREVELGHVDPLREGSGADQRIAALELKPGDELKYVYDFGDWIQHRLTLEAIDEPETGATYPRVIDQNKPRRRYCQACKDKGRQTVATWICIECSNAEQQEVLVCDACLDDDHEDHYADEVLY